MSPISVAVVEDDPNFLKHFLAVVEASPQLMLAGSATTAREGMALIDRVAADVFMIDLGLPDENGIGLIHRIAEFRSKANVMVVTVFGDDEHLIRSIEAGATGYLLKDALPEEMVSCIRELHDGGSPMSPVIARRLLRRFRPPAPTQPNPLSERETEILVLIAKGLSFAEVGETLDISPHTVVAHMRKIYGKLAVRSRGEAVFEAHQMGLIRSQ